MKRKHDEDEHMDESWLIPYADLLTLLLALFIVLFATSTADQELMAEMKDAFYEEYTGIMPEKEFGDGEIGIDGIADDNGVIPPIFNEEENGKDDEEGKGDENSVENAAETVASLTETLQEEFSNYIKGRGLEDEMKIESKPDGLLITLTSDIWFPSGSAEINGSQKQVAAQISRMIARVQERSKVVLAVLISGHTDNVPISGTEFESNWRLSVIRAVNFMEELMNSSTLEPSNFSASGFGEYQPIASNKTSQGRQRNRRVEVMIAPRIEESK